jgi:hypothetical protein
MKAILTLLFAGIVFLPRVLPGAPVSWTVAPVSGPADVSKEGLLRGSLAAGNRYGATVNGVFFWNDCARSAPGTWRFREGGVELRVEFANGSNFDAWTGLPPGEDATYGDALDCARWSDEMTGADLVMGLLIPGHRYLVQLWIVDTRPGLSGRVRTVDGVATTGGGANVATGIFTADGSSQTIHIGGVPFSHGPQLNMFQVRDLTPLLVTNVNDSGPGSLRHMLQQGWQLEDPEGLSTIAFDPALDGQTIVLQSGLTAPSRAILLDAGALPRGVIISTAGLPLANSALTIPPLAELEIRGVKFQYCKSDGDGGAIQNHGTLLLSGCSFDRNASPSGGAVFNKGSLTARQCTFGYNSSSRGGAIHNEGSLTASQSTFHFNHAGAPIGSGGAILNNLAQSPQARLHLVNCTLAGNWANTGGALMEPAGSLTHCTISENDANSGGGIYLSRSELQLENTIIANNRNMIPGNGADVYAPGGAITRSGVNFVESGITMFPDMEIPVTGSGIIRTEDPGISRHRYHGGATMTCRLLPGSPALDAAVPVPGLETDQRGFHRSRDGDLTAGALPDVGAYEAQIVPASTGHSTIVVTTSTDEDDSGGAIGTGVSLREALKYLPAGDRLIFDAAVFNGEPADVIMLEETLGELAPRPTLNSWMNMGQPVTDPTGVIIDGGSGVVIDGGSGPQRLLHFPPGGFVVLQGLRLTGGNGGGFTTPSSGGAILNEGSLQVSRCTLDGNEAAFGGAIHSSGTLTVSHSTFTGNSAGNGGAIHHTGPLALTHCTVANNSAVISGGGIQATVPEATASLAFCLVAGNSAPYLGTDVLSIGTVTRVGANLIQNQASVFGGTDSGPPAIAAEPLLAPLGNYGGPTPTMALLPGSPARNAAGGSTVESDQRGFTMTGIPDLGAYEAGTVTNCVAWLWETLPADATEAQRDPGFDFDGDGQSNGDEWVTLTNPAGPEIWFNLPPSHPGTDLHITFSSASGRTYTLWSSVNLAPDSWAPHAPVTPLTGDGSEKTFIVPIGSEARGFFRVQAAP